MSESMTKNIDRFTKFDLLSFAGALCIATIPWSIRLNTLVIICFGVGLLIYTLIKKGKVIIKPKDFFIGAAIFIVALIWLIISSNLDSGLKYIERSLSALIFPFLFAIIYNQYRLNLKYILIIFMVSCLFRYLFFLYDVLEIELIFIFDYWKEILIQFNQLFKVYAIHPSYFSMFLGFCSMICYDFFTKSKSTSKRVFWILGLILFFVFNISLSAKMPMAAFILSLMLGAFIQLFRKSTKMGTIRTISLLFIGLIGIGLFLRHVPNAISQDLNNYYQILKGEKIEDIYDYNQYGTNSSLDTWEKTNRIHIWKSSIDIIKDNFLIGVGTGDINQELNLKFKRNNQDYLATKDTNSHNQFLDYLIKYGVIGFLIISFVISLYFKKAWIQDNQLYLMFLMLCCFSMLTENILNRQYGIVFFFFVNSLFFFYKPLPVKNAS